MTQQQSWLVRFCRCGYPVGGLMSVLKLKKCPDCHTVLIPVEDRTVAIVVRAVPKDEQCPM